MMSNQTHIAVPSSKSRDYDLMTIGGGSAAFAAAIKAAELGARVAIVEKGTIGGTCVNIGCVPSKTLIKAAELCYHSAYPQFEGLTACPPPSGWQRVVQQKDELVASLRQGKYVDVASVYPNITMLKGEARLLGGRQVRVNGTVYEPEKIVVATGSCLGRRRFPAFRKQAFSTANRPSRLSPCLPR
jgi:mercuric reductase